MACGELSPCGARRRYYESRAPIPPPPSNKFTCASRHIL
ncbi:Hypothetical protein ETEE_1574 [Edwardsiella anguillarum ET080813]|uniref:Uncharacterized protein n=1 Tax=Edwardsiella anguillarum ET080813 TaxID=667120 RepID=A0A076LN32_9GAMM|nr:Hypothetical protein ETEE_1574 [Edwardsiella anguillarum ET080813]